MDDKDQRRCRKRGNGGEIIDEIEWQIPVKARKYREVHETHQQCISIRHGLSHEIRTDHAAGATAILDEDIAMCRAIGTHGATLIPDGTRVLTHCNAGALATAGIGTALAPVYVAHEAGRAVHVFADETRPLLQGSRLTAWELERAGVPVTVITDAMAASLMRAGEIDMVFVGADRIVRNGDGANKIGTYNVAVIAKHHGIPFYVCAPWSTIDHATTSGAAIEIEQRHADEVRHVRDTVVAPVNIPVRNPAFDVTPHELVTAIVTDRGIFRAPYAFTFPHAQPN